VVVDREGHPAFRNGIVVPPEGTTGGMGTQDSYFAIIDSTGSVVAETELPPERLDKGGRNKFPPLLVPSQLCQ